MLGVMGIALRLGMRLGALTEGDSDALRRSRPTSMVNDCARLRTMAGCAAGASEATGISQCSAHKMCVSRFVINPEGGAGDRLVAAF